ncbi:MAG: thermonuclease family protein [Clostridia bacterium]|nr:thermonuclease family protein [Clostridia bacterium]
MMKRLMSLVLALLMCVSVAWSLVSCNGEDETTKKPGGENPSHVDYAASVTLDMNSSTLKQEVTVYAYIDGDTTHFNVPENLMPGGILKARYLAVNTPESTGKIEEFGKTAAQFTRSKLIDAESIIVESEDGLLNADSTGSRYMLWIWYKPAGADSYRNLNIELLQEGLAIASNSAASRYGDTCVKAINQAKAEKLHVYSGEKDPNFPYGAATELTLKELRCNLTEYDNVKVAFEGVVTKESNQTVYVEEYDPETGLYYGMTVYYGYSLKGKGREILSIGNRVRIVGSVQYYEQGNSYQVSGIEYSAMRPNDPNNIQKLGEGYTPAYVPTTAEQFLNGKVTLTMDEEGTTKTFDYTDLAIYTSIEMKDLVVTSIYTTVKEESSSKGAMTLTCRVDGKTVTVRTIVLQDENGALITENFFKNKTITVRGIIDCFEGEYQIKLFSIEDVVIQ